VAVVISARGGKIVLEQAIKNIEDFRADARHWGLLRSLFSRVMLRLQRFAGLNIHWILVRDLVRPPAEPHVPDGITVRLVQAEELLKAARDPELKMSSEFVHRALGREDIAFGAFDGDSLVCYSWRAFASIPQDDGVWVKFGPPYHYAYKAFTLPSYRGRRILVAVALFSDSCLLERGRVAQVAFTEMHNFASLAAQKVTGSRRIGLAGYVKCFGMFIPFRTAAVKKIGFAFALGR
jgi:hypothetical protein